MAYVDTRGGNAAAPVARRSLTERLLQPRAASGGRPAVERAFGAHTREVRQMLFAALLAAATIVAVAVALLVRS